MSPSSSQTVPQHTDHTFSDINISQGSVVTHLMFGGIENDHSIANLLWSVLATHGCSFNEYFLLYWPKPIHCNYHVGYYSGFSRISPSILN